ncbi:hypothetical protein GCM10008929_22890 [Alkalibacterium psychrotolerans]
MSVKQKLLLVSELLQSPSFVSASDLAKKIQASQRTVYIYLDEIEESAKQANALLERKTGKGIRLIADGSQKRYLKTIMENNALKDMDPDRRQVAIVKRLLDGETLSYSKLADDYFVSRSTLVKDMKQIKSDYFPEENVLASSNEGTCIKANERTVQLVWRNYLSKQFYVQNNRLPLNISEYSQFIQQELEMDDKDSQFLSLCVKLMSEEGKLDLDKKKEDP